MQALAELFPRTNHFKPSSIKWDRQFEWGHQSTISLAIALATDLTNAQQLPFQEFIDRSLSLRNDLTELTASTTDESIRLFVDVIKFTISQPPAFCLTTNGEFAQAYDWILWSISRDFDPHQRVNEGDFKLPPFDGIDPKLNEFVAQFLVDWISSAYFVAVKFGGLDELAHNHFYYCYGAALTASDGTDRDGGIEALVSLANWAAHVDHSELPELTRAIEAWLELPFLSAQQRIRLGTLLIGNAAKYSTKNIADFAQNMLENHEGEFRDHEQLQFLIATVNTDELWAAKRGAILSEIKSFRSSVERSSMSKIEADIAMEARITLIYPLIHILSEMRDLASILEILAGWYGKDYDDDLSQKTLLILPNSSNGVTWIWPGGSWTQSNQNVPESLERLLECTSRAFNDYFRGPKGDRFPEIDERLLGAPNPEHATETKEILVSHYGIDDVLAFEPTKGKVDFVVPFPNHNIPLFPFINQHSANGLAQNLSMSPETWEPEFHNILVWPGDTLTTEAEIEFMLEAGRQFGCNVRIWEGELSKYGFAEFYSDHEADVLWVIGHGNHASDKTEDCGLNLPDGEIFSLRDFSNLPPVEKRRALVANFCSGGAARMIGAIGATGVSYTLVNEPQMAVAHDWPIDMYGALAFGTVFFSLLPKFGFKAGLFNAQRILQDHEMTVRQIERISKDLKAVEILAAGHVKPRLENILTWGATSLYR